MPDWFRESDEYAWFQDNPAPHQVEEDAKNRAYEAALEESRNNNPKTMNNESSSFHYRTKADAHKSWAIIWGLVAVCLAAYAIGSMTLWSFILGGVAIGSLLLCISQLKKFSYADNKWLIHVSRNRQF